MKTVSITLLAASTLATAVAGPVLGPAEKEYCRLLTCTAGSDPLMRS
jgi:hypothetical protein